ncbi:MAG: threonine--tRNA ligase [Blastocatellia bacterium]|nr:threonine--tRNA ligase [Blastocatellia bacterium]MCS7158353.1 threonine--tRNA ligase [Blastocatellia bacterium]MDW8167915.1 threonine--tRNA ligase [Acidobacteriota bacterium]MDW8255940.1 threonine--tRNA ligase [Acidobacteriota bacterium]
MGIWVRLPGKDTVEVPSGLTAGEAIAHADGEVAKRALVARVNGQLVDLAHRPEEGSVVEPVLIGTPEALEVYRHSTAHLLAAAVLELFPGTLLGIGPATDEGFFYDFLRSERFTPEDLERIEAKMRELIERNIPYERIEIPKEEALRFFAQAGDYLKCELITDKGGEVVSCYKLGEHMIDFCTGPHIPSTGYIKAFKLLSLAGAYWRGDERGPQMQRIYGTSFFTEEELQEFLRRREEAERRDHRKLGRELDLFSIQEDYGPGLIFWHPKGGIIRKEIEDFLKEELLRRGYGLVYTPHIAQYRLWQQSGHTEFYRESMYAPMRLDEVEYQLKPMNCPFHIGIYASRPRSYRELPMRLAEFGTVYRYERSGVLHGLLRVRGFTQDDAHIFCTPETLKQEIMGCLDLAQLVYRTFGFAYTVELSVRDPNEPDKYMGGDERWTWAERTLAEALEEMDFTYTVIEGEAAFYGPKIDIKVVDAIGRQWQLGTIQLDFNLPERFDLEYVGEDNRPHRPIMIHRAILGSLERFFGILIEHYAGAFPLWLAPVQAIVLPITDKQNDYARAVQERLRAAGLRVDVDLRGEKIGAKIRQAQLQKIPFMLVVGAREVETETVSVRERGRGDTGAVPVAAFLERALHLIRTRAVELETTSPQIGDVHPTPARA